jgi:hypothetical protein
LRVVAMPRDRDVLSHVTADAFVMYMGLLVAEA